VERVCHDSTVYEPIEVKKFLIEAKLVDPCPLIHVCDRYDFIDEMTSYRYSNKMHKQVQKMSPHKTSQVIDILRDLECNEDIINTVGPLSPISEFVEQVDHHVITEAMICNERDINAEAFKCRRGVC
jgi:clathrin heavy chain